MKHFDNNELNPSRIKKLLNSRIIVNDDGYNHQKKRFFYRYIKYDEYSQNIYMANSMSNTKTRKYNISTFIKKAFFFEYSQKAKKSESSYKVKRRFLLEMEELLNISPAITVKAKEKLSYILENFFFYNISCH